MTDDPSTTDPFAGSRRRRGTHASWWFWSLTIHALLFLLLWFSPARELVFEKKPAEQSQVSADRERVEEVAEKIDEMQKELMLRKLERLEEIREEMEDIRGDREEDFRKFARDLAQDSPVTALVALEKAEEHQEMAFKEMEPMEKAAQKMPALSGMPMVSQAAKLTNRQTSALKRAEKQVETIKRTLTNARTAEQNARKALAALKKRRKPEAPAHQVKRAEQRVTTAKAKIEAQNARLKAAETARRDASTALSKARREAEGKLEAEYKELRTKVTAAMAETRMHQREAQSREQEAAQKIGFTQMTEASKAVESAIAQQAAADAALDQAQEEFSATDGTRRKLAEAQRKLSSAQSRVADSRKRIATSKASEERRQKEKKELVKREEALEDAEHIYDEADAAHREAADAAGASRAQTRTAQAQAREATRKAIAVLKAAASRTSEVPLADISPAYDSTPPDPSELSSSDPAEQILETAGGLEEHIAENYRIVKAVEEAAMRQVPVSETLKKTRIAMPDRETPDLAVLEREAKTAADVEGRKHAYRAAQSQLSSSVSLAEQMLIQARGAEDERGMTIDYEGMKVAAARHQAYTKAALEESDAKAKDVSALMQGKEQETADASPDGSSFSPPWPQTPTSKVVKMPDGRRFTTQAGVATVGGQWVSVNDWYCIGPFPNPARREVDTRFPPDSVIDLDASYTGMGGKMVSWQYLKSPTLKVSPPNEQEYGIYYFYTELWFDEPMDLWLAVGSDDNLRVWIEEKMVWLSAYELKSWRIDEGFRKVHFNQGHNKILVRLENGWHGCDFSFLLHVGAGK